MRSTAVRRALVGMTLAIGLPLASAGAAFAQSAPSGPSAPEPECPSGPSGVDCPPETATTVDSVTVPSGGGTGLARTGVDAALPLVAGGAALAAVLGGRRLATRNAG